MKPSKAPGYQYSICVEGHIGLDWVDWPWDVVVEHCFDQQGTRAITLLDAALPDQPALYGLLEKFRDLNVRLVYLLRNE